MDFNLKQLQEAYISMYTDIIAEEIHPELQKVLDQETDPRFKLTQFTKQVRQHIKNGVDTGLENDKPLKGQSRAVFFPKEEKEIHIDGKPTKLPTAVKIAFHGQLDKYHGEDTSLGEDQNESESNRWVNNSYGVLRHTPEKGQNHYTHKPDGILAPVFDTHHENHYLEMGRVSKFNTKDFREATKTKDFPKGISHDDLVSVLEYHHDMANGRKPNMFGKTEEHMEKLSEHPYVDTAISMMHDTGLHPGDVSPRNMGIWHHPITGTKHPVMIDWGFTNDISKKYGKARENLHKTKRGW